MSIVNKKLKITRSLSGDGCGAWTSFRFVLSTTNAYNAQHFLQPDIHIVAEASDSIAIFVKIAQSSMVRSLIACSIQRNVTKMG